MTVDVSPETDGTCTLCELPLEATVVTDDEGNRYCCAGCKHVAGTLDDTTDPADVDGAAVAEGTASEPDEPTEAPPGTERAFFQIEGMHCSTCEVFIEGTGAEADGVADVAASYVSETVRVDYDPDETDPDAVAEDLTGLGYTAYHRENALAKRRAEDQNEIRLIVGVLFGMVVMMQYLLLVYPLHVNLFYPERTHEFLVEMVTSSASVPFFIVLFALTSIVLFVTGGPILRGAYVSLKTRNPNMDLLVALAATAAYVYSTLAVLVGEPTEIYYDVTVAIVLVVTVGGYYEGTIKQRATEALADLSAAQVDTAERYEADGSTTTVDVSVLTDGDRFLVRGGERIPVDGVVAEGDGAVDEAVITGESLPVSKEPGDRVVGGSILAEGSLVVGVDGEPTSSVDRIADLVWDLQSARGGIQGLADRLATIFVPVVVTLALVVTAGYLVLGAPVSNALLVGLTVLIVSCPCALGLATPLAVASSIREALERGIVVFDETVFERIRDVDVVVFDKTGTLTTGEMEVLDASGSDTLLERAGILEQRSAHPVAGAIANAFGPDAAGAEGGDQSSPGSPSNASSDPATDGGVPAGESARVAAADGQQSDEALTEPAADAPANADDAPADATTDDESTDLPADDRLSDFESYATGVGGTVDGEVVLVGHPGLFAERGWTVPDELADRAESERTAGRLPILVGRDGTAAGIVVVGDEPRDGWDETVTDLADRGVEVVVLTGDEEAAATRFREHDGVAEVFAGVPPEGKAETVRRLRARGKTAMVGDGTNDAPALASADLGIALGGGTALAADAADVAIVDDDLSSLSTVFAIANAARRRVRQNIGWAFVYNAIAIPLAVSTLINPLFAAVAMGTSSLLVVTNSSRALLGDEE
ncbi:heavy metal translocating P-type ATPase [Halovivax ruber XH-70]|uniref:Heavy metal translocating P-type ATPase n=1 Tax=Halovivax ruber (strain DSM 18193 / JCM 13892 / XH-70) TaxID=797302 RepID=L0II89_HALRX|nr:cation-translocating P-type ATPase [Halovivax ruber]AGB17697.1 heavy metal translocating P-type ATPase [Halovivax ruber XH-70]